MNIVLLRTEKPEAHVLEDRHLEQIRAVGSNIQLQAPFVSTWDEVEKHLKEAEIVVGFPNELSAILLAQMPHVKWLHTFSAGLDKVLTPELKASDIVVSNSSGVHAIPIAEHVLGCMLLFAKKFPQSLQNQAQKQWQTLHGIGEIRDARVLVVGLGRIGTEIAKVAAGAGMRVIAVDQPEKEKPNFVERIYGVNGLLEALPEADYIVLALPYTKKTHHLFNMEKFRIMKDSAVLVNIGRGPVVHEQELIEALQGGVIAGAALDVTETEPLPQESPLWAMENVVITPHHSSHTKKRMNRTIDLFCENLKAYIQKVRLPTLVDKQKGY
jgi:D-2-hydroxyacid dehydrogenase (NADP+)